MAENDINDLAHDPEFDSMRVLGRVCSKLVETLERARVSPLLNHVPLGDQMQLEPEECDCLAAAIVVVNELHCAGIIRLPQVGPVLIRPTVVGHA